jgi:processive 1,2-diacylglycerol beta-glucosyltransferase
VAEVLADELRRRSPGCYVGIYDYIETCVGHGYNVVFTSLFFGSVRWAPQLYRSFYCATSAIPPHSSVQRFINSIGKRRLAALLRTQRPDVVICTYCLPAGGMSELKRETQRPDVVICTYCLPAGGMSELKREGCTNVPCVTVVTDHAVHSQWIHPAVDLYLVSSDRVRDGFVARGIPPDRILPHPAHWHPRVFGLWHASQSAYLAAPLRIGS